MIEDESLNILNLEGDSITVFWEIRARLLKVWSVVRVRSFHEQSS